MVLVLLGTQKHNFTRLLKEVEKCIEQGIIKENVIVQAGSTKYESEKMEIFDLIPKEELEKIREQANYIICHGGVGSIVGSLKMGKKVIAVPRLKIYDEHINDHQMQIVETFDKKGYIKGIIEIEKLGQTIQELETFKPNIYISNTDNIIGIIEEYIDKN